MAKKIEVFLSEYEYLKNQVEAYAFSLAKLDVENMNLKQELEEAKKVIKRYQKGEADETT